MTKIITINSCRECPYCREHDMAIGYSCRKFNIEFEANPNIDYPEWNKRHVPDTIHPDCKLNDLPTVEEIEYFSRSVSATVQMARTDGATFVINKINEQH